MKLLITGGCGFVGSHLAASALDKQEQVFIIDSLFRLGADKNKIWLELKAEKNQLMIEIFDIADAKSVNNFFEKFGPFDGIAHLAGQVAMTTSMENPRLDFLTNVVGTFNLLEATRHYSPKATFIYASTNKVYGEMKQVKIEEREKRYISPDFPNGFNESFQLDFSSPYGCSKGAADQYVRDWHRNYGLNTIVFRHSSIYGGRQYGTFDQGWISWFSLQALLQKQCLLKGKRVNPFTIAGNGKQLRDILYIDDLINLYEKSFLNTNISHGEIFNIGGGINNSVSLLELFNILSRILDIELIFEAKDWRHSDQKFFVCNVDKINQFINWQPRTSCLIGIEKYLNSLTNFHELN
ncbi:GDP-mannose 4,6-dehydratase [Calothrix membranacea FACHB-236]|nr:GDP-mannose 4,6-dehydratase [Calothrix membranacea FACHB-236]